MHRRSAPAYSGRPANARRERIKSNGKNRFRASRPSSPGRGLPVGVPRAHPGSRISPPDRAGTLRRIVPDQLVIECVSGHSRPRVRSPVQTGVPPWPRGRRTCGDLPHEARCRRPEGRCVRADAPLARTPHGQTRGLRRCWPCLAHRGARSGADRHRAGKHLPVDRTRQRAGVRQVGPAPCWAKRPCNRRCPTCSSAAIPRWGQRTSSPPWRRATKRLSRSTCS